MGSTTVIDQLIVKLGLDPRDFTKGEKEVASSVLRTKETVRKGTDDMARGAESAAKSIASSGGVLAKVFSRGGLVGIAIALAIAAGKKINDMLYEVAENTRRLGLDARNFNATAAGLRNIENAAELAGGSLEDAVQSAGGLTKSLYDLRFNGQISDSLIMLARLGVQFQDASGKQRDFKDIALDTADALERLQKSGQMTRGDAYFAAQQAGFSGGLANLVADGRGATAAGFARQEARRQVNAQDVAAANRRVIASQSLGQAGLAEVGTPAMTKESPIASAVNEKLEKTITGGMHVVDSLGTKLSHASDRASMALGDLADATKRMMKAQAAWFRGQHVYGPALDAAADKYGIDRDVLRGIARTESGYDPNAVARNPKTGKVTGKGIMQLNPQFFPGAGQNPYKDIDTAAQHFAALLEKTEGTEQERYVEALRMYNAGEKNYREGTNIGPQNKAYAGKVLAGTSLALPTPNAQGSTVNNRTDVTFENVTIQTPRTDGRAVADEFIDTTRRKMLASHADAGVQ